MALAVDIPRESLAGVANEIVRLKAQYYGKGPTEAKAYMNDEVLVVARRLDADLGVRRGEHDPEALTRVVRDLEADHDTPARHRVPVKLKKGPNALLIKIVNGNDPHGMYFALTSEQELKAGK